MGGGVVGNEMKSRACELCYLLASLSWKTQFDPPFAPALEKEITSFCFFFFFHHEEGHHLFS
jgi:hypothetical protein